MGDVSLQKWLHWEKITFDEIINKKAIIYAYIKKFFVFPTVLKDTANKNGV